MTQKSAQAGICDYWRPALPQMSPRLILHLSVCQASYKVTTCHNMKPLVFFFVVVGRMGCGGWGPFDSLLKLVFPRFTISVCPKCIGLINTLSGNFQFNTVFIIFQFS